MLSVASLGLFSDGIALRHALKAVNGLHDAAEKGTGQKKNTEETRHIRNLLNSGRSLLGFAMFDYTINIGRTVNLSRGAGRDSSGSPSFLQQSLVFLLTKNTSANKFGAVRNKLILH